jgi:hypothetical protein
MSNEKCREIKSLLVDYADGALPAAESNRVAAHLAGCPRCREEVRLLRRSLELARAVWREEPAASRSHRTPHTDYIGHVSPRVLLYTGAAVCAVLLFFAIGLFFFVNHEGSRPPMPQDPSAASMQVAGQPAADEKDLDTLFDREERAARLAMSVQILAGQPGLEKTRADAENYLRRTYADTRAVLRLGQSEKVN